MGLYKNGRKNIECYVIYCNVQHYQKVSRAQRILGIRCVERNYFTSGGQNLFACFHVVCFKEKYMLEKFLTQ